MKSSRIFFFCTLCLFVLFSFFTHVSASSIFGADQLVLNRKSGITRDPIQLGGGDPIVLDGGVVFDLFGNVVCGSLLANGTLLSYDTNVTTCPRSTF